MEELSCSSNHFAIREWVNQMVTQLDLLFNVVNTLQFYMLIIQFFRH